MGADKSTENTPNAKIILMDRLHADSCIVTVTTQKSAQKTLKRLYQMPQNLSAQIVCPSPIVLDFDEKQFH